MDIDWACELVEQVNGHWREQLRPRYGLSDDEYFWESVANMVVGVLGVQVASHVDGPAVDYQSFDYAGTAERAPTAARRRLRSVARRCHRSRGRGTHPTVRT